MSAAALSQRELEVLRFAAAGKTTGEIAAALFVSTHTVVSHRRHLFEKLGARTMAQAVAEAARRGLLELDQHRFRELWQQFRHADSALERMRIALEIAEFIETEEGL